jgi:hypothetical protein
MRLVPVFFGSSVAALLVTLCVPGRGMAQRHSAGASPPTAPARVAAKTAVPIFPVSSGMGPLQFLSVNYGVPAPQALTRQLEAEDERTRGASLAAIGAPSQYLQRGHVPFPHSVQLDFVALGTTNDLDAILTVELDQHLVSAILLPEDGDWKRIATILYQTNFSDPTTMPSTFLRVSRSLIEQQRYRAIFRATTNGPNHDSQENEAHLRILNNRAVITMSFVDSARSCDAGSGKHAGCTLTRRWLQPDLNDPHHFTLVTGTGRFDATYLADPLANSLTYQIAHLRTFSCQPFLFSEQTMHYEPTANESPCLNKH